MALACGLAAGTRRPLVRLALLAAIGFLAIGLVESESRGGLLAALLTLAAAVVVYRGHRAHALLACAIAISVAATAFAASPAAWQRVSSLDGGGNGRADLWRVAWRMAGDHPLVGVGLNNFRAESSAYVRKPGALQYVDLISERPHVVHNVYLQLLAEAGVVGLALFLFVASACIRSAWRAARRFDAAGEHALSALARAVVLAIGAGLAASFFISNATDKRAWVLLALGPALFSVSEQPVADGPRAR
jgi:O-antigen ligase